MGLTYVGAGRELRWLWCKDSFSRVSGIEVRKNVWAGGRWGGEVLEAKWPAAELVF